MECIRKLAALGFACVCLLALTACGGAQQSQAEQAALETSALSGPWQVTVESAEVKDSLSGTKSDLQYNGETVQTQIEEKPGEGNVFLIVRMAVEKTQTGAAVFSWSQLYTEDSDGSRYSRMSNDSFIENYGYERIKATNLTLGKNEGAICFELPASSATGSLALIYESDEGNINIPLN